MQLNTNKSVIIIGTHTQLAKFDSHLQIEVAGTPLLCRKAITSLGVTIDSKLSFTERINSLVSLCNYHLRAFRHIRPVLSDDMAETVGRAIVLSLLDYCNSLLVNIPACQMNRLRKNY